MKAITEYLFQRGKAKTFYCRRIIPAAVRAAYSPNKTEIVFSLKTSDRREAAKRLRIELVRLESEFEEQARKLKEQQAQQATRRLEGLSDEHLQSLARFWVRQVLLTDDEMRLRGMDDQEFDELGNSLNRQREELGRLMARGQVERILPALNGFIHLCGIDVELSPEQSRRAGFIFLQAAVAALDHQLERQKGNLAVTDSVIPNAPHPITVKRAQELGPDWETVFDTWENYVEDRPKPTVTANRTPWNQIMRFAAINKISEPSQLTPDHMSTFVAGMKERRYSAIICVGM